MIEERPSPNGRETAQVEALNQRARAKSSGKNREYGRLSDRAPNIRDAGSRQVSPYDQKFASKDGIFLTPPYPFNELAQLMETCSTHYACVKAKAAAISGVGWKISPNINYQALHAEISRIEALENPEPEDEEKKKEILDIIGRIRFEYEDLMNFFNRPNNVIGETWIELNKRRDEDCEALGNGFWEIVRNFGEKPAEIYHMPAISCRLLANGRGVAQAQRLPPVTGVAPDNMQTGFRIAYFKFFGDPWIMDVRSGRIHGVFIALSEVDAFLEQTSQRDPSTGELIPRFLRLNFPSEMAVEPAGYAALWVRDQEGNALFLDPMRWATEVIWFKKYHVKQGDGYGVPDIIAAMPAVTGTDGAHQYQLDFFNNSAVPAHIVHLKGFPASNPDEEDDPVQAVTDYFDTELRGPGNSGKTLVLSTPPELRDVQGSSEGGADVQVQKIAEAVSEASFLGYLENNFDEVLRVERTPIEMIATVKNATRPSSNGISIGIEVFKNFVTRPEQALREEVINRLIQDGFGYDWTFKFAEIDTLDELREMEVAQGYFNIHCITANEIRAKMGREPLPGGDRVFIVTPTGTLFLDEMENMTTSQTAALPSAPLNPKDSGKQTGRGNSSLPGIGPTEGKQTTQNNAKGLKSENNNAYGLEPQVQWFLAQQFSWNGRKRAA